MSILAEFFVATNELAAVYDAKLWPQDDLFMAGGLIPMHLELLWAILQNREWEVDLGDDFDLVCGDGAHSWTLRFPSNLTSLLAEASTTTLDEARIKWANVEELSADPDHLIDLMAALHRLAQNAMSTGRSLYLWGVL